MSKTIKLAYIGGGSKLWARTFMSDLAVTEGLSGEVALYDIDREAAERNAAIGNRIRQDSRTNSPFSYYVCDSLDNALQGADFVAISILPGTFREMRSDVHTPEKYGVYQPVGDTVGPGGVLRAMRTIPLYEEFARKIQAVCPQAWVINFTNPMSACVKALYDTFPDIKAFGCCHEVFHAQDFLTRVLQEIKGIDVSRHQLYTDACGVNHFTWITEARYQEIDLLVLLPEFLDRYYETGYGTADYLTDPFVSRHRVKMDLYRRYGALAAAGDRHLVEFLPGQWYLRNPEMAHRWCFGLTTVDYRERQQADRIAETVELAEGRQAFDVKPSGEEAVDLIKAILGLQTVVSNVNMPNRGQMSQLPLGSVVETNCVFSNGQVKPVVSNPLPEAAANLVYRNCANIDLACEGAKERDLDKLFAAFINQPLCATLSLAEGKDLFREMCHNTREYLEKYYKKLSV